MSRASSVASLSAGRDRLNGCVAQIFVDSGSGKSDVYRIVFKPIQDRQKKDAEEWASDRLPELKMLLEIKDEEIKRAKKDVKGRGTSKETKDNLSRHN